MKALRARPRSAAPTRRSSSPSEELERARRWGAAGAIGRALRVLGTLEREDGIDGLARGGRACSSGSPARLELREGARRARRRAAPRRAGRARRASRCGARSSWPRCAAPPPLAEHVRAELHAPGARPRTEALIGRRRRSPPASGGWSTWRPRGRRNRDIAQTLFVTPKTVEVHLSNAYRKLGIRSRRELGDALGRGEPKAVR